MHKTQISWIFFEDFGLCSIDFWNVSFHFSKNPFKSKFNRKSIYINKNQVFHKIWKMFW